MGRLGDTWNKIDESKFVQPPNLDVLASLTDIIFPMSVGDEASSRDGVELSKLICSISPHLRRRSSKAGNSHSALEVAILTHDAMANGEEGGEVGYFERRGLRTIVEAARKFPVLFPAERKIPIHDVIGQKESNSSGSEEAAEDDDTSPPHPLEQTFTKEECLCLLACAFLCLFPRASDNCSNPENTLPSINYDEQLAPKVIPGRNSVEVAKNLMVLDYFDEMTDRWLLSGGGDGSTTAWSQSPWLAKKILNRQPKTDAGRKLVDAENAALKSSLLANTHVPAGVRHERYAEMSDINYGVTFIRRGVDHSTALDQRDMGLYRLTPCKVHPLGESIDDQKEMIRADFANRMIGGGAIAYGCVQEEIMFSICPELVVSRLIYPPMMEHEAIVALGSEQFSLVKPRTYAGSLQHGGKFSEKWPVPSSGSDGDAGDGKQPPPYLHRGVITCIDAADFRYGGIQGQYSSACFLREYMKSFAGFDLQNENNAAEAGSSRGISTGSHAVTDIIANQTAAGRIGVKALQHQYPSTVATGNWGCGAFLGDPEFKILIQWLSCCAAGKEMHYFPFTESKLLRFQQISDALVARQSSLSTLDGPDDLDVRIVSWEQLFNDCVKGKFNPTSRGQSVLEKVISYYDLQL